PSALQKDLELVKLRVLECREPRDLDVWLHSAIRVAKALNPYLAPDDVGAVWTRMGETPCFSSLHPFQRRWIQLFRAIGARDSARMGELAAELLSSQREISRDARQYLAMAAMAGYITARNKPRALEIWSEHKRA